MLTVTLVIVPHNLCVGMWFWLFAFLWPVNKIWNNYFCLLSEIVRQLQISPFFSVSLTARQHWQAFLLLFVEVMLSAVCLCGNLSALSTGGGVLFVGVCVLACVIVRIRQGVRMQYAVFKASIWQLHLLLIVVVVVKAANYFELEKLWQKFAKYSLI